MKSLAKRKASMTEEELKVWKKKQSDASMKSRKARIEKMKKLNPAAFEEFKKILNKKAKDRQAEKKAATVIASLNEIVSTKTITNTAI